MGGKVLEKEEEEEEENETRCISASKRRLALKNLYAFFNLVTLQGHSATSHGTFGQSLYTVECRTTYYKVQWVMGTSLAASILIPKLTNHNILFINDYIF